MRQFLTMGGLGLLFTWIAGTLLHFLYEWSGKNRIVGLFAPVSESVWEHLKLLFFPMMTAAIVEFFLFQNSPQFLLSRLIGVLAGMGIILILFYTYSGILGYNLLAADILTFFIGAAAAFFVANRISFGEGISKFFPWAGFLLLTLLFGFFTVAPPKLALFKDPSPEKAGC